MYTVKDFLENSICITKNNMALVNDGDKYKDLLKSFQSVHVTEDFIFSGLDAINADELFFLKDKKEHLNDLWWQKQLCYITNMVICSNNDKFIPVSLIIKTKNHEEKDYMIKFDLLEIQKELKDGKKDDKENIMNAFLNNLYISKNDELLKFQSNFLNDILNKGVIAMNDFTSSVVATSLPVLLAISYLDQDLTESFRIFLNGFLNIFLDTPFKS